MNRESKQWLCVISIFKIVMRGEGMRLVTCSISQYIFVLNVNLVIDINALRLK